MIEEIYKMAISEEDGKRRDAAELLGEKFPTIEEKENAWLCLQRLARDESHSVRWWVVYALRIAFTHIPDKLNAWLEMHKLVQDKNWVVRWSATEALGQIFLQIPDKQAAWNDLIKLVKEENLVVRWSAARSIGQAFPLIHDQQAVWIDLRELAHDKNQGVRCSAAEAIGQAFPLILDKHEAWLELDRIIRDKDCEVRSRAAEALGQAFQYVPDKHAACVDFHILAHDEDQDVRWSVAGALGQAIPHIPDKQGVLIDLQMLAQDTDQNVRSRAVYALGRGSIFKATEAENNEEFKTDLEKAIEFFDKASIESESLNPAAFCLPFYRSLHSLLFTTESKDTEVQKYLFDARNAVEESESKEKLLDAVENLSKALKEVRSYTEEDLLSRRQEFKAYTRHCFQAADCIKEVRRKAPFASKIIDTLMIEKAIFILKDKIEALISEAEGLCRISKGTTYENIGRSAYYKAKGLERHETLIAVECYFDEEMIPLQEVICKLLPETSQKYFNNLLKSEEYMNLEKKLKALRDIMQAAVVQIENEVDKRKRLEKDNQELLEKILGPLRNIESTTSKLKIHSYDTRQIFLQIQQDIKDIQSIMDSQDQGLKLLGTALDEKDHAMIGRLEIMRKDLLLILENIIIQSQSNDKRAKEILIEIQEKKKSNFRDIISISSDVIQIGSYLNWALGAKICEFSDILHIFK